MHIVDMAGPVRTIVLTSKSSGRCYRRDPASASAKEVIELEDVKTGISITDLGLMTSGKCLLKLPQDA